LVKIVLWLKTPSTDDAWKLREVINQWTDTSNTKVNNVPLLCMVETDEERKPLNAQCGKWHGLMRFANIAKTHYNVEVQQAKGAVIARVTIPNQVRPAKVAFYLKTERGASPSTFGTGSTPASRWSRRCNNLQSDTEVTRRGDLGSASGDGHRSSSRGM
jgi:hypothetical protein